MDGGLFCLPFLLCILEHLQRSGVHEQSRQNFTQLAGICRGELTSLLLGGNIIVNRLGLGDLFQEFIAAPMTTMAVVP